MNVFTFSYKEKVFNSIYFPFSMKPTAEMFNVQHSKHTPKRTIIQILNENCIRIQIGLLCQMKTRELLNNTQHLNV